MDYFITFLKSKLFLETTLGKYFWCILFLSIILILGILAIRDTFRKILPSFVLDSMNTLFIERIVKFNISIPIFGFGFIFDYIRKSYKEGSLVKLLGVGGILKIKSPNPPNPPKNDILFSPDDATRWSRLNEIRSEQGRLMRGCEKPIYSILKGEPVSLLDTFKTTRPLWGRLKPDIVINMDFWREKGMFFYDKKRDCFISAITGNKIDEDIVIKYLTKDTLKVIGEFSNNPRKMAIEAFRDTHLDPHTFRELYPNTNSWPFKLAHNYINCINEFLFVKDYRSQSNLPYHENNMYRCKYNEKIDVITKEEFGKTLYQTKHLPYSRTSDDFDKDLPNIVKHIYNKSKPYFQHKHDGINGSKQQFEPIEMLWSLAIYKREEAAKIKIAFNNFIISTGKQAELEKKDIIMSKFNFLDPDPNNVVEWLDLAESEKIKNKIAEFFSN